MNRIPPLNAIDDPSALLACLTREPDSFATMPGHRADSYAVRRPTQLFWDNNARLQEIADLMQQTCRHPVVAPAACIRLFNADFSRWGCVLLHNASPAGDVEMLVLATPAVVNRCLIQAVARWVFWGHDYRRVTFRIRASAVTTHDYARRLGFSYEGKQSRWFADDEDAILFGMRRDQCHWA